MSRRYGRIAGVSPAMSAQREYWFWGSVDGYSAFHC